LYNPHHERIALDIADDIDVAIEALRAFAGDKSLDRGSLLRSAITLSAIKHELRRTKLPGCHSYDYERVLRIFNRARRAVVDMPEMIPLIEALAEIERGE
jgi:hypothetical protein